MRKIAAESEWRQHAVPSLPHAFAIDRRDFFKILGGGLLVSVHAGRALARESGTARHESHPLPQDLDSWLHVGEDGQITVFTGKVEVGQNIRTSLAQQVAEDLRVPLASVRMVMGDTELTPYDMGTFGSRTTPTMGLELRNAAEAARSYLVELAAERWQLPPGALEVAEGKIRDPRSGRTVSYSELTRGKKLSKVIPADPELTPAKNWAVAGHPAPKVNARDFVTGKHQYTSDIELPGLQFGKVARPRAFHAKLISSDISQAAKMPGVTVVHDGDFIGVAAPDLALAERAVSSISLSWDAAEQISEAELFAHLKKTANQADREESVDGSIAQGRRQAATTLERSYTVAYIAHVPLEPRAAVAEWKDGKLTVWTGTQRPFAVREELANAFHLPESSVRVIVPDTGSAYGGKHTGEAAVEAARLAKAAQKPVKLVWTREEEFTWAYFRPAGLIEVRSGVSRDGKLLFWEFENYNSGAAAISTPYQATNQRTVFYPSDSPLRQGSYRSLAAAANHFARESHMDELAHEIQLDALEFRLRNLKNERLRAVLEAAANQFGWGKVQSLAGRGSGIAGGVEKGGYVATCAEVAIEHGVLKVVRVVEAFDCGAVVNPQGVKNQIAGAVVQGLGGAVFEAVHFENGRILNPHLAEYRVPRFRDLPQIEVVVIDRKDQPAMGAGETPLTGIAPAVANAIFSASGMRLRSMPLVPRGLPKQVSS